MASVSRWPVRRPRVVITGLGVVSCLASNITPFWRNLVNGQTGITRLSKPELEWLPCRVGGTIQIGDSEDELNSRLLDSAIIRQRGLASMYGLIAAEQALNDAKWTPEDDESTHFTGVSIGRVSADMDAIGEANLIIEKEKKLRRISPYTAARAMCNVSAFTIGEKFGFLGPQLAPATACAAGAHSIIGGYQALLLGDAKVMVCGGADSVITPLCLSTYAKARALSTKYNETPELASRPFDTDRDGFVPGDGAAVLVLEELEHALSRGATIHAEMLGYGMCRDSGTVTSPDENGLGVEDCMSRAVVNSSLKSEDVGYVNAHATSTPTGDSAEAKGILRTFGENSVHVASNKGALGHMQGAAGAVEAISSVLSCRDALIPPTVNLVRPEIKGVNYVMNKAAEWDRERRIVVSNSFGFGSSCASLVFSNYVS